MKEKYDINYIYEFLNKYENNQVFRKQIQQKYTNNKSDLSNLEIYILEKIIKLNTSKENKDFYLPAIENEYDTLEQIQKSAITIYSAQVLMNEFDYKDLIMDYKEEVKACELLKKFFTENKDKVIKEITMIIDQIKFHNEFGRTNKYRSQAFEYYTNVHFADFLNMDDQKNEKDNDNIK